MSDAVWRSWFALADLYEYDFSYEHAYSLYTKVWKESPPTAVTYWLAALKCAEHIVSDTIRLDKVPLLYEIVNGDHPFPLPRLIAAYYIDKITEIEFLSSWESMFPQDSWSLYYISRKLLLQGNREEALSVMRVLQRQYTATSWRSFQIMKILRNEERWR
jgi:hypothetical protein